MPEQVGRREVNRDDGGQGATLKEEAIFLHWTMATCSVPSLFSMCVFQVSPL